MRSGSTITGMVFGYRTDTFYWFEPFWKLSPWEYLRGNETACRADRLECRYLDPDPVYSEQNKSVTDKYTRFPNGSLPKAMTFFPKMYDCQFNDDFAQTFVALLFKDYHGPRWNNVTACWKEKVDYETCFMRHIPRVCKQSMHRVTKVLRSTIDLFSSVFLSRDNLKVIHLFRDPRAIINSRIETDWYPVKSEKSAIENAKGLCHKMLYDFREGQKLQKLHPYRFRFIYYEDFSVDISNKSKILYDYLGMNVNEKYYPAFMKLPSFKNAKTNRSERENNSAFWWRKKLKWSIVEKMEQVCKDVYKELGYRSFTNIKDFKNVSIPSLVILKQYLIV